MAGLTQAEAEAIAGGPTDPGEPAPLAFVVGGVREVFEETCILLGAPDPMPAGWTEDVRRRVHQGETSFAAELAADGVRLDLTGLVAFARWITPEGLPKRYDTRFYAALAPPGAEAATSTAARPVAPPVRRTASPEPPRPTGMCCRTG